MALNRNFSSSSLSAGPVLSKSQQIKNILRDYLVSGKIAPGEMLPPESELVKKFQVSRNTLRDNTVHLSISMYLQNSILSDFILGFFIPQLLIFRLTARCFLIPLLDTTHS